MEVKFKGTPLYLFEKEWRRLDFSPEIVEEIKLHPCSVASDGIERYFKCIDQKSDLEKLEYFLLIIREED